jgi:hypothetical protein
MSQPTVPPSTPGQAPEGAAVNVPIGAIIENVNQKWSGIVALLVQENAQLQAGLEAQGSELAYLRSAVAAQNAIPEPAPDGVPSPLLLGPVTPLPTPADGGFFSPAEETRREDAGL